MKTKVVNVEGDFIAEITLPSVFSVEYRPDLIKKAVLAMQSNRLQPKGPNPLSGLRTSAEGWGTGMGVSRVPRIKTGRRAARVPQAVGGRKAHPPKPEKVLEEKINKKERRKAIKSAIAATANDAMVRNRGHVFNAEVQLPIVVEDSFAGLTKTSQLKDFLERLGVWGDVLRAKERKIRAGKGKMRGRRYKRKKSILMVYSGKERGIKTAARNLPGVDVSMVENLNAELLAPGTHPGRLTIWTESAINCLYSDTDGEGDENGDKGEG
jgi:large subunit ribosomal protein L4e